MAIAFSSCSETDCCVFPEETTMTGTWKLSKLCFSNGASACNEEDMWDADIEQTLTFTETEFTFDTEGDICNGSYIRVGETNVELTSTSGSCNFDASTYILSRLSANEMIFSPLCIEGCPHLYIKEN